MEEAEHALWRAAGLSIAPRGSHVGFPRVAAAFEYHRPLRFEDEFDVRIRIAGLSEKAIRYVCELTQDGAQHRHGDDDGRLRPNRRDAAQVQSRFRPRSRRGSKSPRETPPRCTRPNTWTATRCAAWQGTRLSRLLADMYGRNAFYTGKLDPAGIGPDTLALPGGLDAAAADDEGGAGGRSGGQSALGHRAHRAARPATRGTARPRRRRGVRCAGSTPTRAGNGRSTAGRWSIARRAWAPAIACSFRFRSGRSSGFWAGFEAACQMGLHVVPGGGMSSHMRLGLIESVGATVVCCTPTYALRLAEVAAAEQRPTPAGREPGARVDRGRRARREHSRHAGAHRAELGRARHRPSRLDRSRTAQLRMLGGAGIPARQRGRVHLRGAGSARPARKRRTASPASWSSPTWGARPVR